MSLEVDYLPVATAVGNNSDSQANFQGSGYQTLGFQNGIAQPYQLNKVMRQASMICSAFANFIANTLNINLLDDGNLANLITNLTNAIKAAATAVNQGVVSVVFSATPVFDASLGSTFQIVLTGNVTSSTLINVQPGQVLRFIVQQDATGGRTFVPPASLPMSAIAPGANLSNVQTFLANNAGVPKVQTPMMPS